MNADKNEPMMRENYRAHLKEKFCRTSRVDVQKILRKFFNKKRVGYNATLKSMESVKAR